MQTDGSMKVARACGQPLGVLEHRRGVRDRDRVNTTLVYGSRERRGIRKEIQVAVRVDEFDGRIGHM
jgi:hypothetical protein